MSPPPPCCCSRALILKLRIMKILIMRAPTIMTAPKPSIVPAVIIRIENAIAATTFIAFEKGKWVCAVVISQAR